MSDEINALLDDSGGSWNLRANGEPSPMSIGLAADAAASRFLTGDRAGALVDLMTLLRTLPDLTITGDRKARWVHALVRHIALWMLSFREKEILVDGETPRYVAGAASNPNPPSAIDDRPVAGLEIAWWIAARLGMEQGLSADSTLALSRGLRGHAGSNAVS